MSSPVYETLAFKATRIELQGSVAVVTLVRPKECVEDIETITSISTDQCVVAGETPSIMI